MTDGGHTVGPGAEAGRNDGPAETGPGDEICVCGDAACPGSVSYPQPFRVNAAYELPDASDLRGYFSVRTSSWEWDGERTDLHDMFGLLWALNLRVREAASIHLMAELNPATGIESEIYARVLALRQEGFLSKERGRPYLKALSREAYSAQDLVVDVFGVPASGPEDPGRAGATYLNAPPWVDQLRRRLRLPEVGGWEFNHRDAFDWRVFTSLKRGVTVAHLGPQPTRRLRDRLNVFRPAVADVGDAIAYRTEHLVNAVPRGAMEKARKLLALAEGASPDPLVIPMDSHFVLVGRTALVATAADCGVGAFERARGVSAERRRGEAEVFMLDAHVRWADRPDPERFEDLVGELLLREPGMHWVRQVGATREPDDGRDFLVDWSAPPVGPLSVGVADGHVPPNARRRIIVQSKLRSKGVGRSDLGGLRDTIEHHESFGILVVAFPRVTVQLMDHLDAMRRSGQYWVDWWGRPELDHRLRMNPTS